MTLRLANGRLILTLIDMRFIAILLLAPTLLYSQEGEAPRAQPVDPALVNDPAEDSFQHARNVYESARRSNGIEKAELYRIAANRFIIYVGQYPRHENTEAAWWYLGECHYALGSIDEAKRCYHTLLNRFGEGRYAAAAAYKLAADHFNNGRYPLAAPLFEKLAKISDQPVDQLRGLYYAGKSYDLQGRQKEAEKYLLKVLESTEADNPYLNKARLDYGGILANKGQLEEAMAMLDKVVASGEDEKLRGQASLEAGAVAAKLGDQKRSDVYFSRVMNSPGLNGMKPDAQIAIMATRFDQKRYDEVIETYKKFPQRGTQDQDARRMMLAAKAYMMLNRNSDALAMFREVERIMPPQSPMAFDATYYRLLCFYRIEGRHVIDQVDAFLQLYKKTRPRDKKVHTAMLMKAETFYAEGKAAEAASVYREINSQLLSEKNKKGMLYKRGRCLVDAGDPEGGAKSLARFIKEYPDDEKVPLALAARGRAYASMGQANQALEDFDALISKTSDKKLLSVAYLESADIYKTQNNLDAMVSRYLTYLKEVDDAKPTAVAKASYWAGWGLVKSEKGAKAIPHLQKARELAPELYEKHAGLLLCLVHLAERNPTSLIEEVGKAIGKGYSADLPEPLIRWAADQAYNAQDFVNAARFYDLIADDENPELVVKEVWRFLGKARIESNDPGGALTAIEHALSAEKDPAWIADGLTDKAKALLLLKRYDEALKVAEEGLGMRPEGRIGAGLHLVRGDILMGQEKADEAVKSYMIPVQLMDDGDKTVKPKAIYKLIQALEKAGKKEDATKYRKELESKYPGWNPES